MDSSKGFAFTGPRHMMPKAEAGSSPTNTTEIDWDNEEHRRCITACLIKGTYVLESERTKLREAGNDTCEEALALAPAWWESFHFRRFRVLACECECVLCQVGRHIVAGRSPRFTYGVIFEYVPPDGPRWHPSAPSYVVAFRGTMRRDATNLGDMRLDLRILLNAHHSCGRFSHAREEVGKFLDSVMPSGGGAGSSCVVWLAGHSLGASIALDVGRIAACGDRQQATSTRGLHTTSYILKHGLGKVLKPHKNNMEEQFEQLSPWVPNLYVHQRDIICKGFFDYFEQRERMQERLPCVAASGTTLSYRDMCRSAFGMQNERPHLLPSAMLWKNQSSAGNPHELRQWWQQEGPELVLSRKAYKWPA
ncbi:GDSL esterase/lipase [Panicum miliaceum]|uniref:GDSL esterase/lipase n=1 Tax=Panicum miliaceum TaxID=4540 RepID=A0A3L6QQH2_PANMI|nr:GDSL esterase/lipase [Panicum miliaceum]